MSNAVDNTNYGSDGSERDTADQKVYVRMRDCTDGPPNTIIVCEDSGEIAGGDYRKNLSGGWSGHRGVSTSGGSG